MGKIAIADRLRYRFDNFMSRGTVSLVSGLALVSLAFILLMAFLVSLSGIAPEGGDRLSLPEAIWGVLMRTLDSGTVGGDTGWVFRFAMLFVTFGGIFVVSTLIGLLSSGIDTKLEDLRKGRSRVIETDHIVILGWSLQVFTLISELALANANRPDTCIVVLSEEDKMQMDIALADTLGKLPRIRLVCRTGSPSSMADLGMVSIQTARSIIILSPHNQRADTQLVKTLLAITNIPRSLPQPYHIVAQVQNPKSLDVINLVGQNEVEILLTNDLISRIVVQTCRQSGLSLVYMDLLDFSGNEIYFRTEPTLQGQPYGKALLAYNDSTVIGIKHTDGTIQLNPPVETPLQPGEQLILISEDDDTMQLSTHSEPPINVSAIQLSNRPPAAAEHTLILGWNDRVVEIIQQLDQYVAPSSTVTVAPGFPEAEVDLSAETLKLQKQTMQYRAGDPTDRRVLESLNLTQYDHVVVLCNPDLDPEESDAETLVRLLHLRDIANRHNHDFQIVTEILDVRNQALAQVARPDDFVISEQIISRMLAQVAEQKSLNAVFADLFNPEGSEIYLKPVDDYVAIAQPMNFYTVVEAARQRGESAIGYRCKADANNVARAYGVVINPKKDQPITFSSQDTIILLAES
ncbi:MULTISPECIES: potassium transporter TrkA [Trichocoleus]|uniref:RCK N-terminal domain-containing protein n=1 Tax=Trichocoleus desertorum GB2-A4 TaxID=2933944 RepID=A0ABV0J7U3_9CYAN|nr:potassium transporter TrkA [Trichocoleus sp. FACHB-46]MBD1862189.1 potassium transporter TrkA [Trichocoleus sp. FACHB-46]